MRGRQAWRRPLPSVAGAAASLRGAALPRPPGRALVPAAGGSELERAGVLAAGGCSDLVLLTLLSGLDRSITFPRNRKWKSRG